MSETTDYLRIDTDSCHTGDMVPCTLCGTDLSYLGQPHVCTIWPWPGYQPQQWHTWTTTTGNDDECETCEKLVDEITLLETELNLLRAHVDDWERYHKLAKRIVEITEED